MFCTYYVGQKGVKQKHILQFFDANSKQISNLLEKDTSILLFTILFTGCLVNQFIPINENGRVAMMLREYKKVTTSNSIKDFQIIYSNK